MWYWVQAQLVAKWVVVVTEIDDLCGAVVRLAQTHSLQAPANAAMCRLVTGHKAGQRMSGAELRASLGT